MGSPECFEDIIILDQSEIVQDILRRGFLPGFAFDVKGRKRTLYYYLTDRMYPNWAIFVKNISEAISQNHKRFAIAQNVL